MFAKLALTIFLTLFFAPPLARADQCQDRACIDVYIQDGHIVIEGRKGTGPVSTKVIAPPKRTTTAKPTPKASPSASRTKKTTVIKKKVKPTVKKVVHHTKAATSLADKLIQSLPTAGISYQPAYSPLVATPVYFWSDTPEVFTKDIEILGEMVTVELKPLFIWHYGDGVVFATRKVGGAYPDGEIRHAYKKPGHYLIELITKWDGAFTIAGQRRTIQGDITTVSVLPITVLQAPIRFTN